MAMYTSTRLATRWEEEQEAEVRRRDAMKLADDERETILQVTHECLQYAWLTKKISSSFDIQAAFTATGNLFSHKWLVLLLYIKFYLSP